MAKAKINGLPGDPSPAKMIESMVRVDHAGEYGATRIYAGQLDQTQDAETKKTIKHMAEQEDEHLAIFEKLIAQRRVRPTLLHPLWHRLGYLMGWGTAAISKEAAMACTVAVEDTIIEHYNEQAEALGKNEPALRKTIEKCRDEEAQHRDTGLEEGAQATPAYPLLYGMVKSATKAAIFLSKRF